MKTARGKTQGKSGVGGVAVAEEKEQLELRLACRRAPHLRGAVTGVLIVLLRL